MIRILTALLLSTLTAACSSAIPPLTTTTETTTIDVASPNAARAAAASVTSCRGKHGTFRAIAANGIVVNSCTYFVVAR